ncbi:MAG TPA: NADP-dependent oxidoreductase [Candidatus Limnocylindrales bacterium]|jgi:NADPH:quinone reductase-like Zn-dependent oxidoreductase
MRAYALDSFGQPGSIHELPKPEPAEGEALIRVRAAGINAFDTGVAMGRAKDYMENRFPLVPGGDAAGFVEALGPNTNGLAVGDEVFGAIDKPFIGEGALAEYVATPVRGLARKPSSVGFAEAAAIPTAGLTALSAIELAKPQPGQTVVILGATGGVGSYATQLAVAAGATVVAVTRGEFAGYARELETILFR